MRWDEFALCILLELPTSMFYPNERYSADIRKAKAVCSECDIRQNCLNWAIEHNEEYGIWGGLTETERKDYAATSYIQARRAALLLRKTQHELEHPSDAFLISLPRILDLQSHNRPALLPVPVSERPFLPEQLKSLLSQLFAKSNYSTNQTPPTSSLQAYSKSFHIQLRSILLSNRSSPSKFDPVTLVSQIKISFSPQQKSEQDQ